MYGWKSDKLSYLDSKHSLFLWFYTLNGDHFSGYMASMYIIFKAFVVIFPAIFHIHVSDQTVQVERYISSRNTCTAQNKQRSFTQRFSTKLTLQAVLLKMFMRQIRYIVLENENLWQRMGWGNIVMDRLDWNSVHVLNLYNHFNAEINRTRELKQCTFSFFNLGQLRLLAHLPIVAEFSKSSVSSEICLKS